MLDEYLTGQASLVFMNRLPQPKQIQVVAALVEGNSGSTLDLEDSIAELLDLVGDDKPKFSPALVSAGHEPQFKLLGDESRRIIALCSRRAGKSVAVCSKMAAVALKHPGSIVIYFGATAKAVRLLIWGPVWKEFTRIWGVEGRHNETLMQTTFGNGSSVVFAGTDDYRHVETFLGGKLRMVCIDEAQSQPDSVLVPLVTRILPPSLSDLGGTLMMSGTIPEVEAGLFYETWVAGRWSKHNWSRFQNPHIESEHELQVFLEESGRSVEDPLVRRDWFGEFKFSSELTAFRYERSKAGYDGDAPDWLDMFSVGIDPGTRDRCAIVVWGWGEHDKNVYQVYEWVTERNANTSWAQIGAELGKINKRWSPYAWYYDAGGSKMTLDTFNRDYGIPVIKAAMKSDLAGQVARLSDLLALGRCKVIIGSALEADLQRAQWDKDARAKGLYRWSSVVHPDAADAARYGLQAYWDAFVPAADPARVKYLEGIARAERNRKALKGITYDEAEFSDDMTGDLYE